MAHGSFEFIVEMLQVFGKYLRRRVSSDAFTFQKKQILPRDNLKTRLENIKKCKFVKKVFEETSMELKNEYIKFYSANILVMGGMIGKINLTG